MNIRARRIAILLICLLVAGLFVARLVRNRALFQKVGTDDLEVRLEATQTLLDKNIIPGSLPGQKIIIRSNIAQVLATIESKESVNSLIQLLNDFEAEPRLLATEALVKIGPLTLPELSQVLLSGNERMIKEATTALGRMGPAAIPFLRELLTHPDAQANACTALGNIGSSSTEDADFAFSALIDAASNPDTELANLAIPVLGDNRVEAAVDPLLKALENDAIRQNAIVALGDIGNSRATLDLIPFLEDSNIDIRIVTARALGQIADPRAAAPLAVTLTERNTNYRSSLVLALQRIGAPAAALLADYLNSPDTHVRRTAAEAMQGAGHISTIPALRQAALNDEDIKVRAAAARALGWDGNSNGIIILLEALHDPEGEVVDAAIDALGAIGPSASQTLISLFNGEDETLALYASRAFANMGEDAYPILYTALDAPQENIKIWAAVTLAEMDNKESLPKLQQLYLTSEGRLKTILARSLSQLGAEVPEQG